MLDTDFPVFVDGQTLTHSELNDLRDFLDSQDHVLGRLIGFGVNCGLDVTIDGGSYVVSPGLAIDQLGRPIMVEEELRLPLDSARSEFDWLTPGSGRTLVLRLEETIEEAPECDEEGCTRHASLRIRTPILELADGCLPPSGFTIDGSELAGVNPLTVTKSSRPSSTGTQLAGRLIQVLSRRGFSDARLTRVADAAVNQRDIPGAAAWKAAFLNRLYFAVLELLRCEALMSVACFRPTETPGVALGCDSNGRWDCNRRHAWEPPTGLSLSLLGADCDDPCRLHRLRIEAMIDGFVMPPLPEPDDDPNPGGGGPYIICHRPVAHGWHHIRDDYIRLIDPCIHWEVPPVVIPDYRFKFDFDREIFVDLSTEVLDIYDVYGGDIDPIEAGTIGIGLGLGTNPAEASILMERAIQAEAGTDFPVNILVVSEAEASRLPGYQPDVEAGITDTIVLVEDARGKVAATGRVPVNDTLNVVGPTLDATSAEAAAAVATAGRAESLIGDVQDSVATIGSRTEALDSIINGAVGEPGLIERFGSVESQIRTFGSSVTQGHLDAAVEKAVGDIETRLSGFEVEIQDKLVEQQTVFRDEMAVRWDRNDTRIDTVLLESKLAGAPGGRRAFDNELLGAFRALSGSLEGQLGDQPEPEAIRAIREVERSIGRMEAVAEAGGDIVATRGTDVVAALEGLAVATRAAGVPARELTELNRTIARLREGIRP